MPTCPINLFPLLFYSHGAEGNTACPHLTITRNADSTTEVRLLEYLRFGGTSHTRKGPRQRASTSDRLWQWFSSCLFRLSCCLSSAATPDRMWGPWVFSVQPLRAASWLLRPCKGFAIGGGFLNCALSLWNSWEVALLWQLRGGGIKKQAPLWVPAAPWPFVNTLPSESSCVKRTCCWADKDSWALGGGGGVSINTEQRLGYWLWWLGCMNNCSTGGLIWSGVTQRWPPPPRLV